MVGKHKLRINLSDEPAADALVSTRTVSLRERLLAKLLGRKQRVTVLVPGNRRDRGPSRRADGNGRRGRCHQRGW